MVEKKLICVICPVGCEIKASFEGEDLKEIEGFRCAQGEEYAREEFTSPSRILTATVQVNNSRVAQLPVRSNQPLPREKLEEAMLELARVSLEIPIKEGQVIIKDILGTGSDMVASRNLEK